MVDDTVGTNRHPTYILNRYVWELLKNNTLMTEDDYAGKIPIIPASQEPEFTALNKPFIVYGYSEDTTSDVFVDRMGSLSYAVWSTSVSEINNILNIIRAGMERHDETAHAVNKWSSPGSEDNPNANPSYLGIRFGSIYVSYIEGPSPEESEGGRQAGIITIRYRYYADYGITLPDGAAWA